MTSKYKYTSLLPLLIASSIVLLLINIIILNLYNSAEQHIIAMVIGIASFSMATVSLQTLKNLKYGSKQWDIKVEILEILAIIVLLSSIAIIFLILLRGLL